MPTVNSIHKVEVYHSVKDEKTQKWTTVLKEVAEFIDFGTWGDRENLDVCVIYKNSEGFLQSASLHLVKVID